eukprot:Skav220014  [mRNA]  locus=scaffold947:329536:330591:+ [translate_table: standard]
MPASESFRVHAVHHASALPDASSALALLERVKRNAEALLRARGWSVLSLVELCCCKVAPEKTAGHVEGWCIPAGDCKTAERIAIRLRTPKGKGHHVLDFESVFGTMLHELAHIVHSKHTPAFYQLMDELQNQWERLEASGQVLDEHGFPTVGGHRVDTSQHNPSTGHARALALAAAEKRERLNGIMSSQRLGGKRSDWESLPPRERAARAAERRAREAALGFGEEEEPQNVLTSVTDKRGLPQIPFQSASLDVRPAKRLRICAQNRCQCGTCVVDTDATQLLSSPSDAAAEEDRLLQVAIAASLEMQDQLHGSKAKEPSDSGLDARTVFQEVCIVVSDDDMERDEKYTKKS